MNMEYEVNINLLCTDFRCNDVFTFSPRLSSRHTASSLQRDMAKHHADLIMCRKQPGVGESCYCKLHRIIIIILVLWQYNFY